MRLALLAIQMLIVLGPLSAEDPFARYFPEASLQKLRAGKTLSASIPSGFQLSLLPAIPDQDAIAAEVKDRKPSIGVELTRIIGELPEPMDTKEGWLLLYNTLHAVSTMKGIPYYSVTYGSNHVLFSDSYVVESAETKKRIADPVFSDVPPEDLIFTFQEDGAFGKNIYQESYSARADHLIVKVENISTITFLFLPVIRPHNLVSEVAIIPSGNELAFYGVSYLTTSMPLLDRQHGEDSLKNRLIAMANWLKSRLGSAAQ